MRLAVLAETPGAPPVDDLIGLRHARVTRRRFLQVSAAVAAASGIRVVTGRFGPHAFGAEARPAPTVAIVGAGIAGLTAAYVLRRAGLRATVYDAAGRTGGRILSIPNAMAPGLVTEFGGEFINSDHEDLLNLVREFGLDLIDLEGPSEATLKDAYFFGGQHYTEAQVVAAFRPIARRIAADAKKLGDRIDFQHPGGAVALDRLPLAEYLRRRGATGWLGKLLEVAYVAEFGLDAGEQSSLNLITMIGTDLSAGLALFGDSDERYKVRGGNQRIIDALAGRLEGQIALGHRLTALRARGRGYALTFERRGAGALDVTADAVIVAIPFTLLRDVEIGLEMPAVKRKAIAELGYGTNAKLMYGVSDRPWRSRGYSGEAYSDEAFQVCWDNSQGLPGPAGGITLFSGGKPGIEAGPGSLADQAARLMPGVERVFPGVGAVRTDRAARWHWPTFPLSRGSYACYKPGQWTSIRGAEGRPVGNVFFAGEHCSLDYQGYMGGGAETGRKAAEAVLRRFGVRR
jgi:monoamine oxidase